MNPRASTLTPSSPITIASDSDWVTYASSGDGTRGNPWIIKNLYIDGTGGVGIAISGTNDYAIIENCFVNNSVAGIFVQNSNNIKYTDDIINRSSTTGLFIKACNNTMVNCTTIENGIGDQFIIDNCSNLNVLGTRFINASIGGGCIAWVTQGFGAGRSYNLTFNNCTFQSQVANTSDYLLDVTSVTNLVVNNCSFTNGSGLYIDGSTYPNYNVLVNDSIFKDFADYGIRVVSTTNMTIKNCNLDASKYRTHNFAITLHNDVDITVESCTITGYYLTAIEGSANTNINYINNVIARDVYSQSPGNGNNNFASGVESGYVDYITIRGNLFTNCSPCIAIIDGIDPIITGNYFHDHLNDLRAPYGGISTYTWIGNFYRDYFTCYPYANLVNLTTNILNQAYYQHGINDSAPKYYAPWFTRNQIVNLEFYSNVDGLGIPLANLHVLLDGVMLTMVTPIIQHVLFSLNVSDFRGRQLYLAELNINVTGIYVYVGLDVSVQIFIHFYSSIDYFGIDFNTVKLFIDGVRYTRYDPIMQERICNITVTDFANVTIYSSMNNFSATGVYIDIPLAIATITFTNNHNFTIVATIKHGAITSTFTIGRDSSIQMRLAMGNYSCSVFENGTLIENRSLTFASNNETSFVVNFGWVKINGNGGNAGNENDVLTADYLVLIIVCVAIGAVIVDITIRRKSPEHSRRSKSDEPSSIGQIAGHHTRG